MIPEQIKKQLPQTSKLYKTDNEIITEKRIVRNYFYDNDEHTMRVTMSYDDSCNNGHNTFNITGEIYEGLVEIACGCLHQEIRDYFPEYAHLIKWHGFTSDVPKGYIDNTMYFLSTKDDFGKEKGECRTWREGIRFEGSKIIHYFRSGFLKSLKSQDAVSDASVIKLDDYSYSLSFFDSKDEMSPFSTKDDADNFLHELKNKSYTFESTCTSYSKGKEIDLEAARECAYWEEATLEDLTEENLFNRLPELVNSFKKDIEAVGFTF